MFVVRLRTPSRANYEHFHVYLAYRRQTGTVVTRQTYDRAPRLTRPPTAHISRGDIGVAIGHTLNVKQVRLFADEGVTTLQSHHRDATQTGQGFTAVHTSGPPISEVFYVVRYGLQVAEPCRCLVSSRV